MARSFSSVISSATIPALQVLRNGELRARHIRSGSFGPGSRQMSILRAFTDGVFERQRIQPDQFVSRLHLRTALDHPDDRAITSDFAFDFRVVRALQSPLFGDRDDQVATRDRVSQQGPVTCGELAPGISAAAHANTATTPIASRPRRHQRTGVESRRSLRRCGRNDCAGLCVAGSTSVDMIGLPVHPVSSCAGCPAAVSALNPLPAALFRRAVSAPRFVLPR